MIRTCKYTLYLLALAFGLMLIISQFYLDTCLGDIISYFRYQYLVFFLGLTLFFLLRKNYISTLIFMMFSIFFILSYSQNIDAVDKKTINHGEYSLTTFNVQVYNGHLNSVIQFIKKENSDIVVLEEVSPTFYKKIRTEKWNYHYQVAIPSFLDDYLVILSRYPLRELKPDLPLKSGKKGTLLNVVCDLPQGVVRIIGVHLTNPVINNFASRTEEYKHLLHYIGKESKNVIVAGDFNTTPWSIHMHQLENESGMHLYKQKLLYQPTSTWVRRIPLIAIPIDHVLLGEYFSFLGRIVHKDKLGSEHHPVTVKFSLLDSLSKNENIYSDAPPSKARARI
jgi:endonuclease/exonuclease/phosphatase (EEP) superfamily protein YafD